MKIMGTTESGFLVEMTDSELCNLVGIEGNDYWGIKEKSKIQEIKNHTGISVPEDKIKWVGLSLPISSFYRAARKTAEGWSKEYDLERAISFLSSFSLSSSTYFRKSNNIVFINNN